MDAAEGSNREEYLSDHNARLFRVKAEIAFSVDEIGPWHP